MCAAVSSGALLRKEHASSSASTDDVSWSCAGERREAIQTSQSVDSPLFKLLEGYVGSWWLGVEVETMRILRIFVLGCSKLLLPMIDDVASLRIDPVVVLSQHLVSTEVPCRSRMAVRLQTLV